jgi:hypothetical protein
MNQTLVRQIEAEGSRAVKDEARRASMRSLDCLGCGDEARLGVSVYMAMHDAMEKGLSSLVEHLEDDIVNYEQCRSDLGCRQLEYAVKFAKVKQGLGGEARLRVGVYMAMHDAIEKELDSLVEHVENDIVNYE